MNIINCNMLTDTQLNEIEAFINSNSFNNTISFLENDMNYFEDFPCFFMAYDHQTLIGFLSVFIPDSASCEIYYHISDTNKHLALEIFNAIYHELSPLLDKYQLYNKYILFDGKTNNFRILNNIDNACFSHSECLMQYDLNHIWKNKPDKLEFDIEETEDTLIINTFLQDEFIGSSDVDISDDYALIHNVKVIKDYRGLGYGTETIYHTIKHLKDNNYSKILLHVNSANTIAFTMYSHHGFNIIQQIDYWKIS